MKLCVSKGLNEQNYNKYRRNIPSKQSENLTLLQPDNYASDRLQSDLGGRGDDVGVTLGEWRRAGTAGGFRGLVLLAADWASCLRAIDGNH